MFGVAILGLIVAAVVALLSLAGSVLLPFQAEFNKKEHVAQPGDIPCPTPGARPTDPDGVRLLILNTTSTTGLAGSVGNSFEELGYTIAGLENAPPYRGYVKIEAGPRGVDDAYTIARYFGGDTRIVMSSAEDRTLNITLGLNFESLPPAAEIEEILASRTPLVPLLGCLPVAEPLGGWDVQSGQSGQSGQSADTDEGEGADEDEDA